MLTFLWPIPKSTNRNMIYTTAWNCFCCCFFVLFVYKAPLVLSSSEFENEGSVGYNDFDIHMVPSFTIQELELLFTRVHDKSDDLISHKERKFYDALTTTGLVAIQLTKGNGNKNDSSEYPKDRNVALSGLCQCATSNRKNTNMDATSLFRTVAGPPRPHEDNDSKDDLGMEGEYRSSTIVRSTIATATMPKNVPLNLPKFDQLVSECGADVAHSMESLRDIVSYSSDTFIKSVDSLLKARLVDSRIFDGERSVNGYYPHIPLLNTKSGSSFSTLNSIVESSTHLEHFHVYRLNSTSVNLPNAKPKKANSSTDKKKFLLLDVHTDAGLFLSFVPGLNCDDDVVGDNDDEEISSSWERSGLYVNVESTTSASPDTNESQKQFVLKRAVFPKDSVGILLGIGMQNWLSTHHNFRATQHAVYLPAGSTRSWYGKMYLVPPEAVIVPNANDGSESLTFADMRHDMVLSGRNSMKEAMSPQAIRRLKEVGKNVVDDTVLSESTILGTSIGCGADYGDDERHIAKVQEDHKTRKENVYDANNNGTSTLTNRYQRRRLQMVDDASACNNSTNFYCWMSCLQIPDNTNSQKYIDDGYSLYCADQAQYDLSGKSVVAATSPCDEVYGTRNIVGGAMNEACTGMWLPTSNDAVATSVIVSSMNNLSSSNDEMLPFCYGGTAMYMDGFQWMDTVCVIYLFPSWVLSSSGKFIAACFGTILAGIVLEGVISRRRTIVSNLPIGWKRLVVSTICYGIQLSLGYLIMLIVMIFSGPLFLSVVIGLMSGHFLFNMKDVFEEIKENKHQKNEKVQLQKDVSEGAKEEQLTPPSCCIEYNEQNDDEENSKTLSVSKQNKKKNIVPEGCTPCCQNDL